MKEIIEKFWGKGNVKERIEEVRNEMKEGRKKEMGGLYESSERWRCWGCVRVDEGGYEYA
ncbi:hypothetical protein [Bacillus pumilus]|uniref:hypothetical protein n=1 Tax=Bacillus pumilus TaxID=1408 RepID=UPI00164238BC|nr:hypothetical protein [Bacillus pumilus]